jgi:hypothetical protein
MAKSKLSSAYKAAGSSAGSYQASLYDVANIGYQRKASAAAAELKSQDLSRTVGMISEGMDLVGNVMKKRQRGEELKTASESLGAEKAEMSLWDKLSGKEQMYEKGGAQVSGSDVMAEYKLQQQEKAFGRTTETDDNTGKVTGSTPKKPPSIPKKEVTENPPPTLAQESKLDGAPPPKQGLNVTKEELNIFKGGSHFDTSSDKSALTQYANWQKSGGHGGTEGWDDTFDSKKKQTKAPTWLK